MKLSQVGLLSCCVAIVLAVSVHAEVSGTPVFEGGKGGYKVYRIPSLVLTLKGTLLAVSEGRTSIADQASNDITLRRSTDQGKTWGNNILIADDGKNSFNNPCMVVLDSGRVLMIFQRYPVSLNEGKVKEGVAGDSTCLCFLTYSDDDGLTWSKLDDITAQVKRPTVATSLASGPGIGLVLKHGKYKNRVIFPINQGPAGKWEVYAAYSDDNGATWKYGELAPNGKPHRPNEVQMVELSDGGIMLIARGMAGEHDRKVAFSTDGGMTWSDIKDQPELTEPRCMGAILSYDLKDGNIPRLLYLGPSSQKSRIDGTIWISTDDGKTWPTKKTVVPGDFAYSSIAILPDGSIAIVYETNSYKQINFLVLPKSTILP